jgi:hypothetical protein
VAVAVALAPVAMTSAALLLPAGLMTWVLRRATTFRSEAPA